tara:strand:+ start:166 stop:2100 length:1935 start_codon:yes stop_codon:yes gene_type:complete
MMTMSLAGCLSGDAGEDGAEGVAGPVGEAGSSLHLVVTADELPDCNTTLLGQIFFVSGEGAFQVCSTTGWAVVDLTGPAGTAGADGLDGTNGTDGADGSDGADGAPGADGADGTNGSASPNTMLTSISSPPATMGCDAGGRVMQQGLDNGDGGETAQNGVLESGEVDYTTTYCSKYVTRQVVDIFDGDSYGGYPGYYMEILVGDTLYFSARNGNGIELWAHDTSNHSTWQVAEINSGDSSSNPGYFMEILVGDTIYFDADDGNNGIELWAHDTSNHSTWLVADISGGSSSGSPGSEMEILVGDTIYFDANDGNDGKELWAHDTSNHSTWLVADISGGSSSGYPGSDMGILVGDTIYFDAGNGFSNREMWAHDTSNHSTWQVADIRGSSSSNPGQYLNILVNDTIYFDADDGNQGRELWAHDTSNHLTWQVADIRNGSSGSFPGANGEDMTILVGDTIYFSADDGNQGRELWAHDTSNHSTWLVADISGGSSSWPGEYSGAILVGDTIYFDANDGNSSIELWAHDTSNHSTWQVADIHINGGSIFSSSTPSIPGNNHWTLLGDTIYFDANEGNWNMTVAGRELWAHDTSNHSTWLVADIYRGRSSSVPGMHLAILVGDTIYFDADDGNYGRELWAMTIEHSITYD